MISLFRTLSSMLLLLPVFFTNDLWAQVALGGELGFNAGVKGMSAFGPGIRVDVPKNEKKGVVFGFNYFLPYKHRSSVPFTSGYDPSFTIEQPTSIRFPGFRLHSAYKHYLVSEYHKEVPALYVLYGFGANLFFYKETTDQPLYGYYAAGFGKDREGKDIRRCHLFGISADVGLGLDLPLTDYHKLHAETGFSYSRVITGPTYYTTIPSSFFFRLGYRYEFD